MKSYLNNEDRKHHIGMLVMWDYLKKWLDRASCLNSQETKFLKTAVTLIIKTSNSIVERMDKSYADRLLKEHTRCELRIIDIYTPEQRGQISPVSIPEADFLSLAKYAQRNCVICEKGKNFQGCELYQLFNEYQVPVFSEETSYCPYARLQGWSPNFLGIQEDTK